MILFVSDLHLDASRPRVTEAFYRFLSDQARQAEALYILGDLFELWVGDDDDSLLASEAQRHLRELADSGTRLYFMRGNRDFLVGQTFAEATGAQLLEDPWVMEIDGQRTILMHGDTLCTADREYQAFREQVRQPQWMEAVLVRSLEERRALGRQIRQQSQTMNSRKAEDIMDVTGSEVRLVMNKLEASRLIHGHTHRPARHRVDLEGREGERIVLGDWENEAWCLRCDGDWELVSWSI